MDISTFIEHTNLHPCLTIDDIDRLVDEADENKFVGICIPPFWVKRARRQIDNKKIILVTVAGFPFGYNMTETKLDEIKLAIENGADEIDVVWNISSFKTSLPWTKIELTKCSSVAHQENKILKVIIETAYLSPFEIERACKICSDAGADFVKTSSGYAPEGANVEHIKLMKKLLPASVGIKASGGIKTYQQAKELILAGTSRLGTSSGIHILASVTD